MRNINLIQRIKLGDFFSFTQTDQHINDSTLKLFNKQTNTYQFIFINSLSFLFLLKNINNPEYQYNIITGLIKFSLKLH
jgi:hypothetical protein